MKPEASPSTAPPTASLDNPNQTQTKSQRESEKANLSRPPSSARQRRLPSVLIAMLVVYGLWLGWLAYVALINVRAGNQ